MADAPDALEVMRRSMVASHNAAAAESRKGKKASPEKIAASLAQAADMAKSIAAVEDRRGIAPAGPSKLEIELVRRPNLRGLSDAELESLEALLRKTQAATAAETGEPIVESPATIAAREMVEEFSDSFARLCRENEQLRDTRDHLYLRVSELATALDRARLDAARVAGAPAAGAGGDESKPLGDLPTQPRPSPVGPPPSGADIIPLNESDAEKYARLNARAAANAAALGARSTPSSYMPPAGSDLAGYGEHPGTAWQSGDLLGRTR